MRENNPPADHRLAGLHVGIVGPGRVGSSLVHWAIELGAEVGVVSGRRRSTADAHLRASVDLDTIWCPLPDLDPSTVDVLILSVSDPAIQAVAEHLATRPAAPVVLHTSGMNDASVLAALAPRSAIGSWHPLRAFATVSTSVAEARGTWFAVDGEPAALTIARRLSDAVGGGAFEIDGDRRVLYHLAASLAAGGVTTVLAMVEELMIAADLPPGLLDAYLGLTRGAMRPLEDGQRPAPEVITGPVARGDETTVARQLASLDEVAPGLGPAVRALMAETRRQVGREVDADTIESGPNIDRKKE